MGENTPPQQDVPPSSYIFQLVLATTPLLGALTYFLYLTNMMVSGANENPPNISLTEFLLIFLAFFFSWNGLIMYMHVYVRKRRALVRLYLDCGRIVFGDVRYDESLSGDLFKRGKPSWWFYNFNCLGLSKNEYADVVYTSEFGAVTKMVRTYQPFYRERVAILVLDGYPKSGLPKRDVEIDVASQDSSHLFAITAISIFWLFFTLFGAIVVIMAMDEIDGANSADGWEIFAYIVGFSFPVSFLSNYIRYLHYKQWLLESGKFDSELPSSDDNASNYHAA